MQQTPGLTLKPTVIQSPFWLYFPEQWDAKSPWHDVRVRQAARLALDLKTINQALTLGFSHVHGSMIPDNFEFFWKPPEPVYDPEQGEGSCSPRRVIQRLRCRLLQLRQLVCESRPRQRTTISARSASGRNCGRWSASSFNQQYARKEAEEHHPGRQRLVRQRGDPLRDLHGEGWRLRLWQLSRPRCDVRAAGGRTAITASARRSCNKMQQILYERVIITHHLAAGVHQWCGTRVGEFELRPNCGLPLHCAVRRHHLEECIAVAESERCDATGHPAWSAMGLWQRAGTFWRSRRSGWPASAAAGQGCGPSGAAQRRRAHHAGADMARSGGDAGHHHAVHADVRAA